MPNDDASQEAGKRLAADLRAQREEQGYSAEDLRGKLQVPPALFEAFESGQLMGHPMFNQVYLRSLTRSYAEATGLPASPVLSALRASLEGSYEEGQLQQELTAYEQPAEVISEGEASDAPPEPEAGPEDASPAEDSPEREGGLASPGSAEEEDQEPDWTTQSPPGASPAEAERRQREKEERAQARQHEREAQASEQQEHRQERSTQREEHGATHRAGRRRQRDRSSRTGAWIVGGLVLVGLVIAAFFLFRSPEGEGGETAQATTAAEADTAAGGEQQTTQQEQPPLANLQLGETMHFTVVAEGGPVRDLKVTRDQDVRRPYWVEEGQAMVFPTNQRIIIENPPEGEPTLQNVRLLAEGYPYPTDRRDDQGRIVITRENMQTFADTVRGQPAQIPAQRDTATYQGGS